MTDRQPTPAQMAKLTAHARLLMVKHGTEVMRIRVGLMDFEIPAQRTINAGFARMGVDRFTPAGDDLWEMVTALENGWEYARPARRLVDRWACA